jgi:GMP synthase (glutamine-hydrolysing)
VLGICYGQQTMVTQLGGRVEPSHDKREFGRAEIEISGQSPLLDGVWPLGSRDTVWMSHGDRVTVLPPGFRVLAQSENAPFAIVADEARRFYA